MFDTLDQLRDHKRMCESYRKDHGVEIGQRRHYEELKKLVEARQLKLTDCRMGIRSIFEEFVPNGRYYTDHWRNGEMIPIREAVDAVTTADFSNIIGQLSFSSVLEHLDTVPMIGRELVDIVPTRTSRKEMIPTVGGLGDVAGEVAEGAEYPLVGVAEEWVTAPKKTKHGFRIGITKEMIAEDLTGELISRAQSVAESIGINMEKEILNMALGQTDTYSRNDGAQQAIYGDTHTNGTFDNLAASNALADYTDIENALLLFDEMTDLNTGEPVAITGQLDLVVPNALWMTAAKILNATEIITGADSASIRTISASPLKLQNIRTIRLVTSPYVSDQTSSTTTWFIGNFKKAFQYREFWPVQVEQAGRESEDSFKRDIDFQAKVSRHGSPVAVRPQYAIKCTA